MFNRRNFLGTLIGIPIGWRCFKNRKIEKKILNNPSKIYVNMCVVDIDSDKYEHEIFPYLPYPLIHQLKIVSETKKHIGLQWCVKQQMIYLTVEETLQLHCNKPAKKPILCAFVNNQIVMYWIVNTLLTPGDTVNLIREGELH